MAQASDIIRVGIIGCGGIANGKHMPGLKSVPGCEMVAFCDLIEEKAQKAKAEFGTPDAKVYTDYKKLLEDKSIDVVHVCTPNRSHSFITVDALEAGKNVMCEKPMAINSAEAKKMLDAQKKSGKLLTIGYQNRQRPEAMFLKHEAEAGTFGDIYFARAYAVRRRAVPNWGVFMNEYEQGGGPLIDIGTHSLDLTLWVMNNYKPKYCVGTTYHKLGKLPVEDQGNDWGAWDVNQFTVEDAAFGFIVMEDGATISLDASWALNTTDDKEACMRICGTKAGGDMVNGIHINGVRQNRKYDTDVSLAGGGAAFFEGVTAMSPASAEAHQWIAAVRENKNPTVLPEQAFTITRILEGIYESAKTGDIYRF